MIIDGAWPFHWKSHQHCFRLHRRAQADSFAPEGLHAGRSFILILFSLLRVRLGPIGSAVQIHGQSTAQISGLSHNFFDQGSCLIELF